MSARYHVLVSDELVPRIELARLPGFRLIEQGEADVALCTHWWLAEDDDADPELEGKRVEITIMRGRMSEDDPDLQPRITERRVLA